MQIKKLAFILIPIFLITCIVIASLIVSRSGSGPITTSTSTVSPTEGTSNMPYKYGIAGYYPIGFPNSTTTQVQQYFADVKSVAQVYGIHTQYNKLQLVDLSARYLDIDFNLVIGVDDNDWQDKREELITRLVPYLQKYPQIKSLAINNEINFNYEPNSVQYRQFVDSYIIIYDRLKAQFPNLKIYTTFQYETLIGKGYLTGKSGKNSLTMLDELNDRLDLIGITTYPYFDYTDPTTIPLDYFAPLAAFNKPIMITETGWPSQNTFANKAIDAYAGSEDEQLAYYERLKLILASNKVEALVWLGVNEAPNSPSSGIFASLGLKKYDGTPKKIWAVYGE